MRIVTAFAAAALAAGIAGPAAAGDIEVIGGCIYPTATTTADVAAQRFDRKVRRAAIVDRWLARLDDAGPTVRRASVVTHRPFVGAVPMATPLPPAAHARLAGMPGL